MSALAPQVAAVPAPDAVARSRALTCALSATSTTVGFALIAATGAGWRAALAMAFINAGLLLSHGLRHADPLWNRLAIVGLLGAPFAMVGDWWCIQYGGLTYQTGGPFVLTSPLYLPMLFPTAVFQVWYTVELVRSKMSAPDSTLAWLVGVAASVVFGGLYVPLYEFFAKWGDLWVYEGLPGAFDGVVPWYVVIAEIIQFSLIPVAVRGLAQRSYAEAAFIGVSVGAATVGGFAASLMIFLY